MNRPTKKQTLLLDFIEDFTEKNSYSPSYREIMHAMGLKSVSAVAEHVDNCVAAGFLRKSSGKTARSLEVIKLKTYDETIGLFRERMAYIKAGNPNDDRLLVLEKAAEILEIEL